VSSLGGEDASGDCNRVEGDASCLRAGLTSQVAGITDVLRCALLDTVSTGHEADAKYVGQTR